MTNYLILVAVIWSSFYLFVPHVDTDTTPLSSAFFIFLKKIYSSAKFARN